MKTADIQKLTDELLANRILKHYDVRKYVDWAVRIIELGYESVDLYMLACMNYDDTYQLVERTFSKVAKEFNFEIDLPKEVLLKRYGLEIIDKTINGEIAPHKCLSIIYSIYVKSGYEMMLVDIYILDHFDNDNLNDEDEKKILLSEFKFCKAVLDLDLESSVRNMYFCEQCQTPAFMKLSKKKEKVLGITVSKTQKLVCGNCSNDYIQPGEKWDENRWKIIDYYKRQNSRY